LTEPRVLEKAMENLRIKEAEFPQQSTHQVKIEDTAKGIRITVHVYSTGAEEAVKEALRLYTMCKYEAELKGIQIAPMEVAFTTHHSNVLSANVNKAR